MSKNPWICALCRSIVSTRFAPGRAQQVRHQLGRDRHARLVLPVLPRVAVVRNHRRDARRRRAAERVDHHAQLDQVADRPSAHVGCTMKTSVPRMFSSIWNETSVSGKRCSRACPIETPRNSAISRRQGADAALPENSFSWPATHKCGWGGRIRTFEYGIQSPAPYRLATPHHSLHGSAANVRRRPAHSPSRRRLGDRAWYSARSLTVARARPQNGKCIAGGLRAVSATAPARSPGGSARTRRESASG